MGYLQDVKFAYNSGRDVLRGISLTIEPGQSVAFVGGSGSGKSTVLKLLMRLYDVSSGTVCVNGLDVRELKQVQLTPLMRIPYTIHHSNNHATANAGLSCSISSVSTPAPL